MLRVGVGHKMRRRVKYIQTQPTVWNKAQQFPAYPSRAIANPQTVSKKQMHVVLLHLGFVCHVELLQ